MESTTGVYFLSEKHAEAIQRLVSDPAIAATTRIPHPYPENGAREFIARQIAAREAGSAYTFAVMDRGTLVGACGLEGIANGEAREIGFWIGREHWGKGYATFAVKMVLEFAFQNLRLKRVPAFALETNAASRRVLEKSGFELLRLAPHDDPLLKSPSEQVAVYQITRERWFELRASPALAALHPALAAILRAELAAGNEVAETQADWPDRGGLFVRLRHPFRARPTPVPAGVRYAEPNDPHGWKAEYSTLSPRHLLVC